MKLTLSLIAVTGLIASSANADIFTNENGLGLVPVIDFENLPLGVVNGDEWQDETGIAFDAPLLYIENFFTNPGGDGKKLAGDMGLLELNITFDKPQSSFAMAWGTNPGNSIVTAYLDGAIVETATLETTFLEPATAFLVVENITFDRIEIDIDAAIFDFTLDNVQLGSSAAAAACPTDHDGNGATDVGDLLLVLASWGESSSVADIDGNGIVDFDDLFAVLAAWGPCP